MITRKKAINTLYNLINSNILSKEIENDLQDIITCIEYEQMNLHLWNADDTDVETIITSKRTDLPEFQYFIKKQKEIIQKYRYTPSKTESKNGFPLD